MVFQFDVVFNYLIVIAVGFAVSGTVSSLYQLVTSERADFTPASDTVVALFASLFMCMFTGPFIIARKVWDRVVSQERHIPLIAFLLALCSLWSFYSGVVFLHVSYVLM
ncbi:MAG TPA: hypothetical protein VK862_19200 [Afifellaceae bacterium]|nr:hypothetical protein [Afifellaceae bacterium]